MRIEAAFAVALSFACGAAAAQTLSLDDALRSGEAQSPRLAAQRAALAAARQQVGRASELPDPRLRLGIENLPVTGSDRYRYDRDFMTMRAVGLMQEFPNGDKREARNLRAERTRDLARTDLEAQRAMVQREIALAWLDVYYAERARAALEGLERQFADQSETAAAAVARGRLAPADGILWRGALEQARDRVIEQDRRVDRARIALAAWLGPDARKPLAAPPDMARLAHGREALVSELHEHPMLRVLDERESLARAEVDLARSTRKSDWALEVGYAQRAPAFTNMVSVTVAMDLPWQTARRQDRDVATKLAELEQARALREDARRMHEADVRGWLADYDAAAKRIERYRGAILPLARERAQAALAAYQGGRGDLAPVLEANRAITEAELRALGAEAERARAWASLGFLFPHEAPK